MADHPELPQGGMMSFVTLNGRRFRIPGTPMLRLLLGIALIIGGFLGFLPILGFWMLPLGVLVLSVDFHFVRRMRRRLYVWLGRRQSARRVFRKQGFCPKPVRKKDRQKRKEKESQKG